MASSNYARRFARREARGPATYRDELLFDKVLPMLPHPHRSGRNLLLLSFALQALVIGLGFAQHFYRESEFGCCSLWAIVIALLFVAVQWTYYSDWCSKLGAQPLWHRANLFVPFFAFPVMVLFWLGGVLSLLAHVEGVEFFEIEWSLLTSVEILSFIVMSASFFVLVWLHVALAVAHRNNLGMHYYAPGEEEVSIVHLLAEPQLQQGSFNYRNILGFVSRVAGLETSLSAERNIQKATALSVAVQIPFYVFAGVAYGQDNTSALLLTTIVIGLGVLVLSAQAFWRGFDRRERRTRKFQRGQLFFKLYVLFVIVFVYFFTCSTIFFQVEDPNRLWEDILLDGGLEAGEKVLFSLSVINIFALLFLQLLVANIHRKAWAEGTAAMDDGLLYGPPDEQGRPTRGNIVRPDDPYAAVEAGGGVELAAVGGQASSSSRVKFAEHPSSEDDDDDESDSDAEVQVI